MLTKAANKRRNFQLLNLLDHHHYTRLFSSLVQEKKTKHISYKVLENIREVDEATRMRASIVTSEVPALKELGITIEEEY